MGKFTKLGLIVIFVIVVIIIGILISGTGPDDKIRYGISPYQDTAMPKVAEGMGLYEKYGLNVELITVAWGDIVPSLSSAGKSVDVALGSINTFLPRAENINVKGGGDLVFYFPFYVFKGATLMMHGDSGMKPLSEFLKQYPSDRNRAVRETMNQLRGKTVAVPNGTPYEQMLLAALKIAGMSQKDDIDRRNVKLANALYAFRNGDADIIGAGVTQRTEALREGGQVFLDMETFGFAEIVGLMTTSSFAEAHKEELSKLIKIWFESVDVLLSDIDEHSEYVLRYLAENASTKYTLKEYKAALEFQEFPRSTEDAGALIISTDGKFHWMRTWDIVNDYLLKLPADMGQIEKPISHKYFLGEDVLEFLTIADN